MVIRLFDFDDEDGPFGPNIRKFFPAPEAPDEDEDDDETEWYPPGDLKAA